MTDSPHLELVRSIYVDWERGDFSHTAEWGNPEMEWATVDGPAPSRVFGLEAMAVGWREFLADWKDFRAEAEEFRELDAERVLVFHHFGGRGKSSGLEVGQTTSKGACLFHIIEAFIAHCDPAIELETAFAAVGGEVYHGHEELRSCQRDVAQIWGEDVSAEPEAYFDLGERVLAFHALHGRGEQSGVAVEMPVALVAQWRDGFLVYLKAYAHREDALPDLGISEDELEPIAP